MHSFHEFLTMGGFALYVWPAYAVTFIVMVASGWRSRRSYLRVLRHAVRRAQEEQQ